MNLNFYPNDFNNNMQNPYNYMLYNNLGLMNNTHNNINNNTNDILKDIQQRAENNLQQIVQLQQNRTQQQSAQQGQSQPYYLFCGNKTDWDEFLMLNYGITESVIFDDYKLFLQAKQELVEEQGKSKKDLMKDKLRGGNSVQTIDSTVKSNVKPKKSIRKPNTIRNNNIPNNRDIVKSDNRRMESNEISSTQN